MLPDRQEKDAAGPLSKVRQLHTQIDNSQIDPEQKKSLQEIIAGLESEIWKIRESKQEADNTVNDLATRFHELEQRLTNIIAFYENLLEQARQAARKDFLTGCYCKMYFQEEILVPLLHKTLRLHGKAGDRRSSWLALWIIDIGHFKSTNDTLGHRVGDRVLKRFGRLLRMSLRFKDFVDYPARIGGDEFAVLMTSVDSARTAYDVALRFRQRVLSRRWKGIHPALDTAHRPRPDIGIACLRISEFTGGMSVEEIAAGWTQKADELMYDSKKDADEIYLKCYGFENSQEGLVEVSPELFKLDLEDRRRQ